VTGDNGGNSGSGWAVLEVGCGKFTLRLQTVHGGRGQVAPSFQESGSFACTIAMYVGAGGERVCQLSCTRYGVVDHGTRLQLVG